MNFQNLVIDNINISLLIKFTFATLGMIWIITESNVFKPIRTNLSKIHRAIGLFFACRGCVGFWSGIVVFLLMWAKFDIFTFAFIGAGIGALMNWHIFKK